MGFIILDLVSKTGPLISISHDFHLLVALLDFYPTFSLLSFNIGAFFFFYQKILQREELFIGSEIFFIIMLGLFKEKKDNAIDSISYQFYRCIYLFKCQVLISFTRNTSQGIFSLSSRNKHYLLYKYKIIGLFQYNSSRYSSVKIEIFSPKWRFLFSLTV